ncbi:MAG: molybdate ABC transporter substrate-binding protein [Thermomicrobiales bacterium]|nr:molybdate ABC transporter substrate-binding protein [Thermomicrobiales bacterium]
MRYVLTTLMILTSLIATGSSVSAEVMCAEPAASAGTAVTEGTPVATPFTATEFPESGGELTIFAAASLTDAYAEMAENLEAAHPGLTITVETAGSQSLVTQLEEGATADVLATANTSTMTRAQESGLISGDPVTFTGNRLVIVTPADNPAGIASIDDLAGDGIRLVLANPDVPAGNYAAKAFCTYDTVDGAPEGFLDSINANLASEESDVRDVLAKVQLGEADAGVVYASDAKASELSGVSLNVIEFPESVPTRASYPIAAVEGGNTELANAFISYVLSDEGQAILKEDGFE